jgi:putative addiction module CopG family antidote
MDVPLSPRLERIVREQLATGRFHDAGEVVAEALRLLGERSRHADVSPDFAFGLWAGRAADGLAYEQSLRPEWDR